MAPRRPEEPRCVLMLERLEARRLLTYSVTDIGSFGGPSYARAINDAGQVAGYYYPTGSYTSHALLYSDGTLTDLDPGTLYSWASGINSAGEVVGMARLDSNGADDVVVWQDGVLTDLGAEGESHAKAINDSGQIAGTSKPGYTWTAFVYSDGAFTDLGPFSGFRSFGTGINNAGQVVGASTYAGGGSSDYHAFLWQDGVMTELTGFGSRDYSAEGINDAGQVIVFSNLDHAFIWDNGVVTDLGVGEPLGINNAGQVVGNSDGNATLWDQGTATNLNDLLSNGAGWHLTEASAIDNAGQIVGYGTNPDGQIRGFLLTPDCPTAVRVNNPVFERLVSSSPQAPVAVETVVSGIDAHPRFALSTSTDLGAGPAAPTLPDGCLLPVSAQRPGTEAALIDEGLSQTYLATDSLCLGSQHD